MASTSVAGVSLVVDTDADVDMVADLLRGLGLEVVGEDGYVEVVGPTATLSIMRGAMLDVGALGGVLLQLDVDDLDAAITAAVSAGAVVARAPESDDTGNASAFLGTTVGLIIELRFTSRNS